MAGSFQRKTASIAQKQGISKERASAELASGARNASAKAVRANPNLRKVSGNERTKSGAKK